MNFKRLASLPGFLAVIFLTGCAAEGIIVKKTFRPLPFSYSLGIDGIYKFQLEDQQKAIREQMVTRDVFVRYEVGDFFSDRMESIRAVAENAQRDATRIGSGRLPAREANAIYENEPLIVPNHSMRPIAAVAEPVPFVHKQEAKPARRKLEAAPVHPAPAAKPAVHMTKSKAVVHHPAAKAGHTSKAQKKTTSKPHVKPHSAAAAKAAAEEADAATSEPKPHFRGFPEPGTSATPRAAEHTLTPRDRPTLRPTPDTGRDTEGF